MDEKTLQHINRADLYNEKKLLVKFEFDTIDISTGIDWEYKHNSNSKTYQVYLHSLGILKSLVISSKKLEEKKYMIAAKELIVNWHKGKFDARNTQAWHEHAVASRIQNILYFQKRAGEYQLEDELFQDILLNHCKYLSKKENYQENNHGIMMDNALIFASQRLANHDLAKEYLEKAYYRVKMALYRDFSKMGVHLENSPEYHKMVLNLYTQVAKNLESARMSLGRDVSGLFNRARMYSSHMLKPNKTLPLIGDSGLYKETISKKFTDFVDHEAGVLISQYRNLQNEELSSWMYFKSGYHSKTHKHKDDLSINLYMNGHDILVDSGKYSYDIKDPIRRHIISPKAHNTVYFKNSDYELANPYSDQIKLKTTRFLNRGNYKISTGINNLYKEGNIIRNAILTRDRILIVVDKITSSEIKEAVQNFNFPETAVPTQIDKNKFEIELEGKTYILESIKIGDKLSEGTIEDGYISYKFGTNVKNKRVEFSYKGKNIEFLTLLYEKTKKENLINVTFKNNIINYDVNNTSFSILI